ncbi:membrane transport protein [Salmonella bongori]|nr:membrane transport protein [Salmonella bongori]
MRARNTFTIFLPPEHYQDIMNKQKNISQVGRAATSGVFFIVILGALMAFTSPLPPIFYLPSMPMMGL